MTPIDYPQLHERLLQLADALGGRAPTQAGMALWIQTVKEFPWSDLSDQLDAWAKRATKMPAPADIWKACNDVRTGRIEATATSEKRAFEREADRTFQRNDAFGKKLRALSNSLRERIEHDPKDWARIIVDRFVHDRLANNGEPIGMNQLHCACVALHRPLDIVIAERAANRSEVTA